MKGPQIRLLVEFLKAFPEAELTGSVFFGGATAESDVDFFMVYSDHRVKTLEAMGFTIKGGGYADSSIASVYTNTMGGIDVQLIHPQWYAVKVQAQKYLANLPSVMKMAFAKAPKEWKSGWWDFAITNAMIYAALRHIGVETFEGALAMTGAAELTYNAALAAFLSNKEKRSDE